MARLNHFMQVAVDSKLKNTDKSISGIKWLVGALLHLHPRLSLVFIGQSLWYYGKSTGCQISVVSVWPVLGAAQWHSSSTQHTHWAGLTEPSQFFHRKQLQQLHYRLYYLWEEWVRMYILFSSKQSGVLSEH